jgi:hypothetical protein
MSGTKKHITALALLLLVAAPLLVSVYYQAKQRYVQHQMKEQLETAALQTLALTGEPTWVKPGKEMWVDGKLFDVKRITPTAIGYTVVGLFDHQETAIAHKAAQQSESQANRAAQAALQCLLLALYQPTKNDISIPTPPTQPGQQYIPYQTTVASISLGVATPPPNQAQASHLL